MRLSDYLAEDRVVILEGRTKEEVLDELTDVMAAAVPGLEKDRLAEAVFRREGLMSTGVGLGIAIPHVRLPEVDSAFVAFGLSRDAISDYESMDEKPVQIVVLIVAPHGRHDLYIKLLSHVISLLKDPMLRSRVESAKTASEIFSVLTGDED